MSNSTSSFTYAQFVNLFGIVVSVILCVLFLILGGHTLKYIKEFACKIKIIVNRAEDKNIGLKDFNYQGRPSVQQNPSFIRWETVFKNEIKRSRSLQICNIFTSYMQKYNHIVYYPFRDKISVSYDLLKPKTTFYTLLVIASCCIAWMITIFLASIIESIYQEISTVPLPIYIGVTVAISIISSFLNILCVHQLFRIYILNVKGAFRIDYGNKFVNINEGLQDYEPQNSDEEEEFLRAKKMAKSFHEQEEEQQQQQQDGPTVRISNPGGGFTQRTNFREDTNELSSTRKLMNNDFEQSDFKKSLRDSGIPMVEEVQEEDEDNVFDRQFPPSTFMNKKQPKKGKRIKDVFDLQVPIDGVDDADADEKYIFVEDTHAIGDTELLNNEAFKGENRSNITTFVGLFLIMAGSSAICCYLNYHFTPLLAQYVFYMFAGAFFGDILIIRTAILFIISLFKLCCGKIKGYRKLQYASSKEVKGLLDNAIKDMLFKKKQKNETSKSANHSKQDSEDQQNLSASKLRLHGKGHDSMGDYFQTQNDRHDTSLKQFSVDPDRREDDFAQEMSYKRDDDQDGNRVPLPGIKNGLANNLIRPRIEDEQKRQFEQTQTQNAYHTQVPLLKSLTKIMHDKQMLEFADVMEKKQLVNELVDYNLLLLRKIYDAFEDRADKVLHKFRSDQNNVLRKRYMVPIINPNYDYEKLLREMQEKGKAKDVEEENSVHLDGETVCEDYEKQLMDAIIEEASDDLVHKKVDRQHIDKFGNPIDDSDSKVKAVCQPFFEKVQMSTEENMIEDDEYGRRKALYEMLKKKLADGEELSQEELDLLWQLEEERLKEIAERLNELTQIKNLTDDNKLESLDLQIEKCDIELSRLQRKKSWTDDEKKKMDALKKERKRLEYERLKLLKKMGRLSKEDEERLNQLENEFNNEELNNLLSKLRDGTMTKEELMKLLQLIDELGIDLSEEDNRLLHDMKKKFGLLSEEELNQELVAELLKKLHDGSLTRDETISLRRLEKELDLQFTDEEQILLKDMERKYGLLSKEELEREELEKLLRRLREGTLTEEELKRLMELMKKFGTELSDEELQQLYEMRKKFGLLTDEEKELEELESLRKRLLNGDISEEELRRLMELQNKYGVQFTDEELEELAKAEERLNEFEQSHRSEKEENFSELPPVVVMNRTNSPPKSPSALSKKLDEKASMKSLHQEQLEQDNALAKSVKSQKQINEELLLEQQQNALKSSKKSIHEQQLLEKSIKSKSQHQHQELSEQELQELIEKSKSQHLTEEEQLILAKSTKSLKSVHQLQQDEENQERIENGEEDADNPFEEQQEFNNMGLQQMNPDDLDEDEKLIQEQQRLKSANTVTPFGSIYSPRQDNVSQHQMSQFKSPRQGEMQQEEQYLSEHMSPKQQSHKSKSQFAEQQQIMSNRSPTHHDEFIAEEDEENQMSQHQSIQGKSAKGQSIKGQSIKGQSVKSQSIKDQSVKGQSVKGQSIKSPMQQSVKSLKQSQHLQGQDDIGEDAAPSESELRQRLSSPEDQELLSRMGKSQQQFNQILEQPLEDEDKNPIPFGREDLEDQEQESVYSHKTTTILDEEKVSFMHIEHLPNQDNGSEDSFDEQDMVYYNKDDLTNYSKGLGLNKVKAKNAPNNLKYFSENDLHEVQESEGDEKSRLSGGQGGQKSHARSALSYGEGEEDSEGERDPMGRGRLQRNPNEIEDHSDLIDGRVKVDSWNLNYNQKKKKLKKKKLTNNQKKKMSDLQDIYGIDAQTLAGLSQGRLPRKLLASGKFNKGGDGLGGPGDNHYQTENSFRSTQNTFANKQSSNEKNKLKQSVTDAQSNMFSFNGGGGGFGQGYGTSKRWNDIESTLKGAPVRQSKMDRINVFPNRSSQNKFPAPKMTSTQQQFAAKPNNYGGFGIDEETKSFNSKGSRGSSQNKQFGNGKGQGYGGKSGLNQNKPKGSFMEMPNQRDDFDDPAFDGDRNLNTMDARKAGGQKGKGATKGKKAGGNKGNKGKLRKRSTESLDSQGFGSNEIKQQRIGGRQGSSGSKRRGGSQSDEIDSHQESDEAVDDKGAMFQKRNGPFNGKASGVKPTGGMGGMNDEFLHSESDEGINQEQPDFQQNEFLFKKRDAGQGSALKSKGPSAKGSSQANRNLGGPGGKQNHLSGSKGGKGQQDHRSGSRSSAGALNVEDLEAQQLSGMKGKQRKQKRQSSSGDRGTDSEEENLGGLVNFSKQTKLNQDNSDLMYGGANGFSNQKPPISGKKSTRGQQRQRSDNEDDRADLHNIYGDPYNIDGKIHPGVSKQFRKGYNGNTDVSDNERAMRGSKYNPLTENEDNMKQGSSSKKVGQSYSNPNLLGGSGQRFNAGAGRGGRGGSKNGSKRQRRNRSINGDNLDSDDDDQEQDFIVGPESNHSMIKKRGSNGFGQEGTDEDNDQYLLMQRERQIMQDIEEDSKNDNSRLAKKRKIRKAAHSHNNRDIQAKRVQDMQNARLMKKKREAENALFAVEDLEAGHAKKKKKKQKKEWVKKEINYWLDYDSPYAEYLVARFKEWSPNPQLRAGSVNSARKVNAKKSNEIKNVYSKQQLNSSRQSGRSRKPSSQSPERFAMPVANPRQALNVNDAYVMNMTQQRKESRQSSQEPKDSGINWNAKQNNQQQQQHENMMFVDDFEEP